MSVTEKKKCCKTKAGDSDQTVVTCVQLKVQDSAMREDTTEKYIGDMVSSDGSNDANIMKRKSQGYGNLSDIFSMIQSVSLGYHYIKIGLIFRETHLLSKLLLNSESWHKLHKYQIDKLEEVDNAFFHELFTAHSKTCTEVYLIESGKILSGSLSVCAE